MNVDKINRKLVRLCRDAGTVILIFNEGPILAYRLAEGHMSSIPIDEVADWTLVECGLMEEEEYKRLCDERARARHEKQRLQVENDDYFRMWQLYRKHGGVMPTKFPTVVLEVARACEWDTNEYVDVTYSGVNFHVTRKDLQ